MKEKHEGRFLRRPLAGAAALLALIVAILFLASLADPAPGLAAPSSNGGRDALSLGLDSPAVDAETVFLPYIARTEVLEKNVWHAEYYANNNLSGAPVRMADEARVDYDWEDGGPSGLPNDLFSIRWSGYWDFEYGEYTFYVEADDGVRLYLDDELLIDQWNIGIHSNAKRVIVEPEGPHHLKLEYFEQGQLAHVQLHWIRTDLYPRWIGTYYRLPWVEKASKVYEETDNTIEFDWGFGCPANLPSCDAWSVAWNAIPVFTPGSHRFYIYADDGYQLYVDGNLKKEGGWQDGQGGGGQDVTYDLDVNALEQHEITFNFHNRGGLAEARLWIQDLEQPEWQAEYYNNQNLNGTPVVVDTEPAVFHNWHFDSPHRHVDGDHFSIRWTGELTFHSGCYLFGLFADDGVRLWVDGELLVDEWHQGRAQYDAPVTYLTSGTHEIIVDYFEDTGEAEIRFWWE
jgi:hypothetical protein